MSDLLWNGPAAPLRCTTQTAIAVTENLTDLPMKKSHNYRLHKFVLLVLLVSTASAEAADVGAPHLSTAPQEAVRWGLGVGVDVKRSLYDGVGTRSTALPLIQFEGDLVRVFGNRLDVNLSSVGPVKLSLRTQFPVGEGYKGSDSPQLAGMGERKGAVLVGVASSWRCELVDFMLAWLKSAGGHNRGAMIRLGAEHAFGIGPTTLVPHLEVSSYDRSYVDYFYGVTSAEATASRSAYQGRGARSTQLGIRVQQALDLHQRIFVDVSSTRYGNGITDSPIVSRTVEPSVKVGYSYTF